MALTLTPYYDNREISPVDALWALYQSQSQRVKKAFRTRLSAEEKAMKEKEAMKAYERSLSEEQRTAAYDFVNTINSRIDDVEEARSKGESAGRSADDFLNELRKQ